MARRGKGGWALGLALLALAFFWLLRRHPPDSLGPVPPAASPLQGSAGTQPTPPEAPSPSPSGEPAPPAGGGGGAPRLALVIDDWGYRSKPIAALAGLGFPVTTAILPNLPHSREAAEAAHAAGDEVILHCPMQAQGSLKAEEGSLEAGMGPDQARALLARHWDSVPYSVGLNNHEGSRASEDPALMAVVAQFLKERQGYFLDSVTTPRSAIPAAARSAGILWARRRVFLDNVDEAGAIRAQLLAAAALARKRGHCIAIGHPRPRTLAVLKELGPQLRAQGLRLVPVSELLTR